MSVELAEMIRELRSELTAAMAAGGTEQIRFGLGPIELELTVVVSKEIGPSAKVKFYVVEIGAEGKAASQTTQRLKLTLDPRLAVAPNRRPLISGEAEAEER